MKRTKSVLAKLDRGYDDYVSGRISEEFWTRRSEQWEEERHGIEVELNRLAHINGSVAVTGEKILELAKKAELLYQTQNPTEQRRLLEALLSNCTFEIGGVYDEFRNFLISAA